jgi:hypothetical protein
LRTIVLIALTAILLGLAGWLHFRFGYSYELGFAAIGVIGVVASVMALYPPRTRGHCQVSNPYLTITRPEQGEYIVVKFEANILNTGAEPDALLEVQTLFYRKDGVEGVLGLIFGAREIQAAQGHILPCGLEPGKSYFVEGSDHFSKDSDLGRFILAGTYPDFVLRSRFVFQRAPKITLRVHPFTLAPRGPSRLSTLVAETRLRMKL